MTTESLDELVTRLAGAALFKLIRGEKWENIVHGIAVQTILWRKENDKRDALKGASHE